MRVLGRVVLIALALMVALMLLKAIVFPAIILAVRLAMLAAVVGGGVWAYRRLSGGSPRRKSLSGGRDRGSLDMQYIRGKIDRETYMRRKTMEK